MNKYDFELDLETTNTMSVIINHIREGSKVLEFGPAKGRLTKYLSETKKCQVDIVEIDEEAGRNAAAYANKAYIGQIEGNIENYIWEHQAYTYDYIIFADVLEHLYNPKEVLIRAVRLLNKEGKVLVSIPNIAHNSIIIDLINDEFKYLPTGLLDNTHIRFFTYNSFKRLLKEIGLVSTLEVPIYSRVGFNEIDNTYASVATKVERALRQRETGSIYQYVFELVPLSEEQGDRLILPINKLDFYPDYEAVCYVKVKGQEHYDEALTSRVIYGLDQDEIIMDLSAFEAIEMIRFDPLTQSAIYLLEEIKINSKGQWQNIQPIASNAVTQIGRLFFFKTTDPQIYFEPQIQSIDEIRIKFKVLDDHIEEFQIYQRIIEELQTSNKIDTTYLQSVIQHRDTDIEILKQEICTREEKLQDIGEVINHRDQDITSLKEVIAHRDGDIAILNQTIECQNENMQEALQVIAHRDRDIIILRNAVEQRTDQLRRAEEQIEKLTREIEAIKETKTYKIINKLRK